MERVKRRWWTWAVSLVAAAVILGAVVSGLFQLAVLALPSYREDLSAWVTEVAHRPVQIGGVHLGWRGVQPRLDLSDITLFDEAGDEVLSAGRLSLGFNPLRLVRGDYLPDRVELSGLSVEIDVDAEGRLRIAGFDAARRGGPAPDWTQDLKRFRYLRIENCELRYSDARVGAQGWPFRVARADLAQSSGGFELDGTLQLPADQGSRLDFSAEIDGAVLDLRSWSGPFEVQTESLQPQGWLKTWLAGDAQIGAEGLDVEVEGRLAGGRLERMLIDVEADAVLAARAGRSSGGQELRASAVVESLAQGWQLDLRELRVAGTDIARGRLRSVPGAQGREIDVDLDRLALSPLAMWFELWHATPPWAQWVARSGGQAESVVLRLRPQADALQYSLRARLQDLSLREDAHLGFGGLSGDLRADQNGGRLQIVPAPLHVVLPAAFEAPLPFERVAGLWQWRRQTDGWLVSSSDLDVRLASLHGNGRVELQLADAPVADPSAPDAPRPSPQIDLALALEAGDLRDAKRYMPRRWPASLRDWLQRAIVAGRVPQAQLTIRGPLADFPYHRRPTGEWKLDLDTVGAALDYAPQWPGLRDVTARLVFSGHRLDIGVGAATAAGLKLRQARAVFEDFDDHLLKIDATIDGDLARHYDFLRASPLHKRLAGLVDGTRGAGAARVDLQLEVPLKHFDETTYDGRVQMESAQLHIGRLDTPVEDIAGELQFDRAGVRSEGLRARFAEVPLNLRIEPRTGTHGVVLGEFRFAPRTDGQGASRYIPALVRNRLSGDSAWRLELPLQEANTALLLASDLQGTAVDLPVPLDKTAAGTAPLRLRLGAEAASPLRLSLDYDTRFGLDLLLAANDGAAPETSGIDIAGLHMRLGAPAPAATMGRRVLDGRVETLDLSQLALLSAGDGNSGFYLDQAELDVGRLSWRTIESAPLRLRYAPTAPGWRLQLDGEGGRGSVEWQRDGNVLTGKLETLALRMATPVPDPAATAAGAAPAPTPAAVVAPQAPADPATWPQLDLDCAQLQLGGESLGHLQLRTARIAGGQRMNHLSLSGGLVQLQGNGQWRRAEQRSSATLRFDLESGDAGSLLKALQYTPNVEAKRSEFSGALEWAPSAGGLEWAQARGRIIASLSDGQLRAVQPGVGRVLGLVNFYALPRRLTLDFDDVVRRGLAFDKIRGSFDLGDGIARTSDLDIEAPSLRMEVRGNVGLAARDYDQRVTVYPDVSAGVTLGAALLGGPAVGALVLLAQELLDKPLDQATQLSYRVTGSWDNPVVERASDANAASAQSAPPPAAEPKPATGTPAAPAPVPMPTPKPAPQATPVPAPAASAASAAAPSRGGTSRAATAAPSSASSVSAAP